MKTKNTIALAIATAVVATCTLIPILVQSDHIPASGKMVLTERQQTWLSALEWCESRGIKTAVNPKDRDGTPSYGLLQFKPSTYAQFAKAYGLASTTDYMNAEGQREIVAHMIQDPSTRWQQQFPDCVKRFVGLPPK